MTGVTPINVVSGDDWVFPFTYTDAAGNPIDLTGYTVGGDVIWSIGRASMASPDGSAVLLDQSIVGNKGKFVLTLHRAATERVPIAKQDTHVRAYLIDPGGNMTSFPAWPLAVEAR